MRGRTTTIIYWMLLLIATCVISGLAWRLLSHENERLERIEEDAVRSQAEILAQSVEWTIKDVEEGVLAQLAIIPTHTLQSDLLTWGKRDPLIRHVFIWDPDQKLMFPLPGQPATQEEQTFIARFEPLFSGDEPWKKPENDSLTLATAPKRPSVFQKLTRTSSVNSRMTYAEQESGDSGCIPWFHENQLHILCWYQPEKEGLIYGVELEWMAILSRLSSLFSEQPHNAYTLALVNGQEKVVYTSGPYDDEYLPVLSIPIGSLLPHWKITCYVPEGILPTPTASNATLLYALLVGILLIVMLSGATMLMKQARNSIREARLKTTFVSNVSHELKTPLTTIRMYAEMLEEKRITDETKQQKYLKTIVSESQRLTRLVNNVLDFSRLEQHRKKYHVEPIELLPLLQSIADQQRPRCVAADMALTLNVSSDNLIVQVDRDALEQTLLNLIDNAIKYASSGKTLELSVTSTSESHCEIFVMDRGPGITSEHAHKIFDKFYRVHDAITDGTLGCGLGLSIARHIMKDMNGDLIYESRAGGGSIFKIILGS